MIAQAAATAGVDDGRAVQARRRLRRGAERARHRSPLADRRRPPRDARGGGRRDPQALHRRGREPPRHALHGRGRPDLHAAVDAGADLRLGLRAQGDRAGGPDRGRLRHDEAQRRGHRPLPRATAARARSRPGRRSAGRRPRSEGVEDRTPALGQLRPAGRARPGAAEPAPLRAGVGARHRGDDGGLRARRARTSSRTSRRSGSTPTRASTRCSSPRWARTRRASSTSGPARSHRAGTTPAAEPPAGRRAGTGREDTEHASTHLAGPA